MNTTKVRKAKEERRVAAAAANRRSRLKKKTIKHLNRHPTTASGELMNDKRPRGRPVKYANDTCRRNAKRASDRKSAHKKDFALKKTNLTTYLTLVQLKSILFQSQL